MKKILKYIDITTIKFLIVGVINTVVGTGLMFILYNFFEVSYWVSSALNYIVGSVISYFLNKYFTFKNREQSMKQILKFSVNIVLCYLGAYGVAKPIVSMILLKVDEKMQGNIAMLVGMCLFLVLNYIGQRFFVFQNSEENAR